VLDLEAESLVKLGKKVLTEIADRFLSTVEAAGYYVALYSNRHWLNNLLDSNYLLKKYDLWLATLDKEWKTRHGSKRRVRLVAVLLDQAEWKGLREMWT
jgi:hypothetical protein